MKQMEVTEKKIGDNTFYIRPFPAFVAANISGALASTLSPVLGGLAALFGNNGSKETDGDSDVDFMDKDIEEALPAITSSLSEISGDKIEALMKKLLINNRNVSVEGEATEGEVKPLTVDLANEVFCGDVQDMYILCFHVINVNFKGFFSRLGVQSGTRKGSIRRTNPSSENTEPST